MGLFGYAIYREAQEGTSVEQLAKDYGVPVRFVEEHLAAARLCFEKQVDRLEIVPPARRIPCHSAQPRWHIVPQEVA